MNKGKRSVGLIASLLILMSILLIQPVYADSYQPPVTNGLFTPNDPPVYPEMRLTPPKQIGSGAQIMGPVPDIVITNPTLDMKVLVIYGNDFLDPTLGVLHPYNTVSTYLDILGIPYDSVNPSAGDPIPPLWDGVSHGYYYAIFFTTGTDWWALPPATRDAIAAYERNFSVREVTWYAIPDSSYNGMNNVGGRNGPTDLDLTAEGQAVFPYLQHNEAISTLSLSADVFGYPGTVAPPSPDAEVTPLLLDGDGNVAMTIFRPGDGREQLFFLWSSYYPATPPVNVHARVLPYGMINWATKGVFLGQRHVYFVPQPDDVFASGDVWDPVAHILREGEYYRLEPNDLDNIVAWMADLRANTPNAADFKMEMPFNGQGTERDREGYPTGPLGAVITPTLTSWAVALQDEFIWLNHTYTHADLYFTSYGQNRQEILQNNDLAAFLGFTDYTTQTLLTGAYSGITNTNLINAAYDLGVQYLLVNASYPAYDNPTPNTGIPHPHNNAVLQVPRHANNVFYFSTTPDMETDYYNWTYCPAYRANPIPANRCLEYPEVIDAITNQSLENLLDFNVNATMFHMNNLEMYNASSDTILGDFVESLFGKFNALYGPNVPILSLSTQDIGGLMWERAGYDTSGASGILSCGDAITVSTTNGARIPVTGVDYGTDTETYAGQNISYLTMGAATTESIPGTETPSIPARIAGLVKNTSGNDVVLTWNATSQNTDGGPLTALVYRVYTGTTQAEAFSLSNMIAQVETPSYTDVGAASTPTYYAITAIGENCWKRESAAAGLTPTAVTLVNFATDVTEGGIELTWETASELNTVGFNLYRAPTSQGEWTQINADFIPSQSPGGIIGAMYTHLDSDAELNLHYYYRLEEIATDGATSWHGPITGGLDAEPTAITLMDLQAKSTSTGTMAQIAFAALMAGSAIVLTKHSRKRQS